MGGVNRVGGVVLAQACKANKMPIIKALIAKGVDVKVPAPGYLSLLHYACEYKNAEMVRVLIVAGADPQAFVSSIDNREYILLIVESCAELHIPFLEWLSVEIEPRAASAASIQASSGLPDGASAYQEEEEGSYDKMEKERPHKR